MLGRPNPYRKTRQAGTLDDLMFDMDKRRHTSFRFQNYQNFITDRPGKFDERYRQKLSWCALDEETGQLDYLTEGLSPTAAGRRASTSSVGSRTTTGDRDSLLPGGIPESSSSSSANMGAGGEVGEEDLVSTPLNLGREDSSGGGLTPPRRRSLTPTGFTSPIASFEGAATVKPSSGRSWVAPQFVIDPENRAPNVLLEDAPARDVHFAFSATEDGIPIGGTRDGARAIAPSDTAAAPGVAPGGSAIALSPTRSNRLRVQTVLGQSPASRSTGSSGRRSSNSAYSFGTSPTRGGGGGGSWARRSGGGSNSNSSSTGSRVSGGANVMGRGATNDMTAVVRTIKPAHGGGVEGGEVECQDEGEGSSPEASAIAGGVAGAVENAGAVQGGEEGNPGREPSYGTVSQAFVSTATSIDHGGSVMASNGGEEGAIPRRSEVSTYFSSIASVVGGADPMEGLAMTSGGTPEGLYTPEKGYTPENGRSEGKEKRGDVDLVVVSTSDPGLLVRPPRVGDGKLEHDKERRLGVAGDLEAVIAELSRRKNSLAWEDGEGACPGAGVRSPGGSGTGEEEELRQIARPEGADDIDHYGAAGAPTAAGAAATTVDEKKKSWSAPVESISPPTNVETLAPSSPEPPTASACVTETTGAVNASAPATLADAPEAQAPAVILAVPEPLSSKVNSTPVKDREPPVLRVKGKEAGGNAAGPGAVVDKVEYPRSPATAATSTVTAASAIAAANASSPRIAARARASAAALTMKTKARASHAASGTQAAGAPVLKGPRGPGKMSMPLAGTNGTSASEVKYSAVAKATATRAAAAPPPKLVKSAKPRSPRARYDAPTASSAAKAYSAGLGASSGKGSGGKGETIAHHRCEQKGQQARGREEGDKAQGKTASRRNPSLRRSISAPPAGYGEEDEVGVDEMVADIVTPSDLVTSVQALADGAAPLSGVPGDGPAFGGEHQPFPNVPDSDHRRTVPSACARAKLDATQATAMSAEQERTDAALTLSGVVVKPPQVSTKGDERSSRHSSGVNGDIRGGEGGGGRSRARGKSTVDRRSMAASPPVPSPSGAVAGTPGATRKGKYQVKNSFNRLKGWIHGGFTGGSGRKNNGFGGTGGGSSRFAAARGSTMTAPQAGSKASAEGRGAPSVGSTPTAATKPEGSKNFKCNAAANRAATRVAEARKRSVERESARGARLTGSSRARQGSTSRYPTNKTVTPSPRSQGQRLGTARDQSLSRTGPRPVPASSNLENDKVNPDEVAPIAVVALIQDRGRALERPLQAASAGSSPSPSPSPPSSPSRRAGVKTEAIGVAPDGCRVVSSTSATPSVAGRVAVPTPPVPARVKTAKPARSLGPTAPHLSGSCRAASNTPRTAGGGGGSGFRRTVESPRLLKSPSANVRSRYPEDYSFTNGARGRDSVVTVGGGTGASGARSQKGRKSVRDGGDSNPTGGSMRRTPKGDTSGKPGRVG